MSATGLRYGLYGNGQCCCWINCRCCCQAHPEKTDSTDFLMLNAGNTLPAKKNRSVWQTGKAEFNVRRPSLFYSSIPAQKNTLPPVFRLFPLHFLTPEILHPDTYSTGTPGLFRNKKHLFAFCMCHSVPGVTGPLNRQTAWPDNCRRNFITNSHFSLLCSV